MESYTHTTLALWLVSAQTRLNCTGQTIVEGVGSILFEQAEEEKEEKKKKASTGRN